MAFDELLLAPGSGGVDRAGLEARLRATPHAFVDPHDPDCWFLCADAESATSILRARSADAARRPHTLLLLIEAERLWLAGQHAGEAELAGGRRLVAWLLTCDAWSGRDAGHPGSAWTEPLSFFGTPEGEGG